MARGTGELVVSNTNTIHTINEMKKPIDTRNCLLEQLCPIFSNRLVSFQCVNLTQITIDSKKIVISEHFEIAENYKKAGKFIIAETFKIAKTCKNCRIL